jgi:SAM-dependent methyltransferase
MSPQPDVVGWFGRLAAARGLDEQARGVTAARMFEAEAVRLREILLSREHVSPLLNLGSSTRAFREVDKPHIERALFAPLREAGVAVFHSDLKAADGVDLAGDILDPAVRRGLKARGFRAILIANMLEHVRDRDAVTAACEEILGPGGLILATAPSSYPYHADPLDTGYRPAPAALAAAFRRSLPLLAEELAGRTYKEDMKARGSGLWKELGRTLLFGLIFFARPKSFAARAHRWLWYRRRYRVSVALVSVSSEGGG